MPLSPKKFNTLQHDHQRVLAAMPTTYTALLETFVDIEGHRLGAVLSTLTVRGFAKKRNGAWERTEAGDKQVKEN